jgi:hypothetical protein
MNEEGSTTLACKHPAKYLVFMSSVMKYHDFDRGEIITLQCRIHGFHGRMDQFLAQVVILAIQETSEQSIESCFQRHLPNDANKTR